MTGKTFRREFFALFKRHEKSAAKLNFENSSKNSCSKLTLLPKKKDSCYTVKAKKSAMVKGLPVKAQLVNVSSNKGRQFVQIKIDNVNNGNDNLNTLKSLNKDNLGDL